MQLSPCMWSRHRRQTLKSLVLIKGNLRAWHLICSVSVCGGRWGGRVWRELEEGGEGTLIKIYKYNWISKLHLPQAVDVVASLDAGVSSSSPIPPYILFIWNIHSAVPVIRSKCKFTCRVCRRWRKSLKVPMRWEAL